MKSYCHSCARDLGLITDGKHKITKCDCCNLIKDCWIYGSKENKETFLSSGKDQVEQKNIQDKNNSE